MFFFLLNTEQKKFLFEFLLLYFVFGDIETHSGEQWLLKVIQTGCDFVVFKRRCCKVNGIRLARRSVGRSRDAGGNGAVGPDFTHIALTNWLHRPREKRVAFTHEPRSCFSCTVLTFNECVSFQYFLGDIGYYLK